MPCSASSWRSRTSTTLVPARRIGVDASTQEANASLRRLVRRDTGEDYQEMLRRLARESGIETPSAEDLIRFDRARKNKTLSNADWVSQTDPEARIARMKDGTTHLGLQAGARRRSRHRRDRGGQDPLGRPGRHPDPAGHAGTGRGHARSRRLGTDAGDPGRDDRRHGLSFAGGPEGTGGQRLEEPHSEKQQKAFARWQGDDAARRAVYNNRARLKSTRRPHRFQAAGEKVERSFAFILDIGGLRRTWLRGAANVEKRYRSRSPPTTLGW